MTGLTLDQLRKGVLAVQGESSVHIEIGNLNPPPPTQIDQDYSTPEGDLEVVVSVEPGRPPAIVGRRIDGEVYLSTDGKHFERVPAQMLAQADGGAFAALLRTDVVRDFTAIFAATVKADFVGVDPSLGAGVARYQLQVDTGTWCGTECGSASLGVPRRAGLPRTVPARLWVGSDGLPVRVEIRHSAPLNGIEGTGTVRVDYSRWSQPVRVERP